MCQGLTAKNKKCKNKQSPFCHHHKSQLIVQKRDRKIPEEYSILHKLLPNELVLNICSYLSFEVTEQLSIKKTPQKLNVNTKYLSKLTRRHIRILSGVSKLQLLYPEPMLIVPMPKKEVPSFTQWHLYEFNTVYSTHVFQF